jgi:hypothetical protein
MAAPGFPSSSSMDFRGADRVHIAIRTTRSSSSRRGAGATRWTVWSSRRGAGDILVIKAGEIHSFVCIGDRPLVQLDVHVSPTFIQENLGQR